MTDVYQSEPYELVADFLRGIGWRSACDAQWTNLRDKLPELMEILRLAPADGGKVDVAQLNRELCDKEGHVLGVAARPCLRCHEWFDPQYGRPAPEPRADHDLLYRFASAVASEEGPDLKDQEAARRWMQEEFWREVRSSETKGGGTNG